MKQNNLKINQLVHGLPNKPRQKQPSMFQIFTWNQQPSNLKNTFKCTQYKNHESNEDVFRSFQNYQQFKSTSRKKTKSQHKIHNQIYMYSGDQEKQKKRIQEQQLKLKKQRSAKTVRIQTRQRQHPKILDQNTQSQKRQIQNRKKKIKEFNRLTRQLPDSAFTTYYGKPAFSNYGSGSKSLQKKTFNVMPHAGKNQPQYKQTHDTALMKSRQIVQTHLPKNPLPSHHYNDYQLNVDQYYNVPIQKPDLVNSSRFAKEDSLLKNKARTPSHKQLNYLPQRQPFKMPKFKKPQKKLTKTKTHKQLLKRQQYPGILKRDNLLEQLQQKKRQQSKLAYKVTECYPSQQKDQGQTRISKWSQMRPAGIHSPRSDHIGDIFFNSSIK